MMAAEAIRVGQALGVEVEALMGLEPGFVLDAAAGKGLQDLFLALRQQARWNENGKASFLQDVLKGRKTEIEYLNGYVVEIGKQVGIETPFCQAAVDWVKSRGGRFEPAEANLASVAALMGESDQQQLERLKAQVAEATA